MECTISQSYYASIENGVRTPSVPVAKKIAGVLDFSWTRFFDIETADEARGA